MMSPEAELRELIVDYLSHGKLLHLATQADTQPWLCHVWYAVDDSLSLYFMSRDSRRHCRELRANSRVAGGVVSMPLDGLGQTVRGLSFSGTAFELAGNDLRAAYTVYLSRWPQVEQLAPFVKMDEVGFPMRLYRIDPDEIVLFDELNFPDDPRRVLRVV